MMSPQSIQGLFYTLLIIIIGLFWFKIKKKTTKKSSITPKYSKKPLMTEAEKKFYEKLLEIEKYGHYKVLPQINLASIIDKTSESKYRSELFRNIDFAILSDQYEVLLCIELNDSTHNTKKRKIRDQKVQKICQEAQIKLIRFYTTYPNEKDYILNRVLKYLEKEEIDENKDQPYSTP